jgi:hypothetical protein
MKRPTSVPKRTWTVYDRIRQILELARANVARSVNTTQVVANWLVGREIVEEEQRGSRKVKNGERLIDELATRLRADFGAGYSATNLKLFRQFYSTYPDLLAGSIGHTARDQLELHTPHQPGTTDAESGRQNRHTLCDESGVARQAATIASAADGQIHHTPCDESWAPGQLHANLSWSLYRHLIRVDDSGSRAFYKIEAVKNHWSARELERQINSLLYERLAVARHFGTLVRAPGRANAARRFAIFQESGLG